MSISAAEYLRRTKSITKISVLRDLANEVIMKEKVTIQMLKELDFREGDIYGNDKRIAYQSSAYAAFKASMNPQAGGAVDLILTGDFVEAMVLKQLSQGKYIFDNTDWKKGILSQKYGKEIFGLNQFEFIDFQIKHLEKPFVKLIKQTAKIG